MQNSWSFSTRAEAHQHQLLGGPTNRWDEYGDGAAAGTHASPLAIYGDCLRFDQYRDEFSVPMMRAQRSARQKLQQRIRALNGQHRSHFASTPTRDHWAATRLQWFSRNITNNIIIPRRRTTSPDWALPGASFTACSSPPAIVVTGRANNEDSRFEADALVLGRTR